MTRFFLMPVSLISHFILQYWIIFATADCYCYFLMIGGSLRKQCFSFFSISSPLFYMLAYIEIYSMNLKGPHVDKVCTQGVLNYRLSFHTCAGK